jgi:hypothetical protein
MREWTLGAGDPLELTVSADFRLCIPDYVNDHIWEAVISGGEPPALALRTTYGLRARSMRIFPRFTLAGQAVSDPSVFSAPLRLRRFYPNYLWFDFAPFKGIDVVAEVSVPSSHTLAGRYTVSNHSRETVSLLLELCVQLVPLEGGYPLAPLPMQSVNVLAGRTGDLTPVVFLTGGPQPGPGPYPSLAIELKLEPATTRTLAWAEAALATPKASLEQARLTAALPWEATRTRIEMVNAGQTVEIFTGDPSWDTAFAFGQKTAFSLFFRANQHLPFPSYVCSRQPDQGYSPRCDGSDYSLAWKGQSPLEATYLAGLLPGAPELAASLLRNFLFVQEQDGAVSWRPGLGGQKSRWLASPLLASLAWRIYQNTRNLDFLRQVQPGLDAFVRHWSAPRYDRDGDGFPEWDHPLQTGFEDDPAFSVWQSGGQGAQIYAAESPALAALLCREVHSLMDIAWALDQREEVNRLALELEKFRRLAESCWDVRSAIYRNRDRDTHCSPAGKTLARLHGAGTFVLDQSFQQALRLLVRVDFKGRTTRQPVVTLTGQVGGTPVVEKLERTDFQWGTNLAVATTRSLFSTLNSVDVGGIEKRDNISIHVVDFSAENLTLFLPLWAGIPDVARASLLVGQALFPEARFGRPFGFPACSGSAALPGMRLAHAAAGSMDSIRQAVHLPWNTLIGEGLLAYNMPVEAAQLCGRLMSAVVQNLKRQHAFASAYHAVTGAGLGDRNSVQGLAPLGLFLETLGVRIISPKQVILTGRNPFPWPVTVKYRGLMVTRRADQTVILFPAGQTLTLDDPTDATISVD